MLRRNLEDLSYVEARFPKNIYHMNEGLIGRVRFLLWDDTRLESSVRIELECKVFVKLPSTVYKLVEEKIVDTCDVNIFQSDYSYGNDGTIDIALENTELTPTLLHLSLDQFKVEYYLKLLVAMKKEKVEVMEQSDLEEECVLEGSSDSDNLGDQDYDDSDGTSTTVESESGSPVLVTASRIVKFYRVAI